MSWLKAKDWATGVEYSSLFHSGLRATSLRPHASRARTYSSNSSSKENSWSEDPSRLLKWSGTRSRHPSPVPSPRTPRVVRPRPSSMFVRSTKEMADARCSKGSLFEAGDLAIFPKEEGIREGYLLPPIELDGVRSLAISRPFFVNLGETDGMGEESFLSLSNSSGGFPKHAVQRRERPVSMQTMPLPSRRSSDHRTRETRRERSDCAWMLEESSPELKAYDPGNEEVEVWLEDERDAADWRQFHVDWVRNMR